MGRRLACALLAALLLLTAAPDGSWWAPRVAAARGETARAAVPESTTGRRRRRHAIDRGCQFIASQQERLGGTFGDVNGVVAITSLCVLALMAQGSTDHRGPYREQVRRGIDFLLGLAEAPKSEKDHSGYVVYGQDQTSRMHGHGFATLALACALGTSEGERSARIRKALEGAVACIEQAQATTGGFGYEPRPDNDHEGSVTVCVAQGLRAARDTGLQVDARVVRHGLRYLEKSQQIDGSFQYSLTRQTTSYALTAAALSSFFLYGRYQDGPDERIKRGLAYMTRMLDKSGAEQAWYYYGHFYAAWALWQWDGHTWEVRPGNHWATWQSEVYPDMIGRQLQGDGSFQTEGGRHDYGPLLSTAFAVLTLSIPDEGLPIFQR
jgi:hypothetical protein